MRQDADDDVIVARTARVLGVARVLSEVERPGMRWGLDRPARQSHTAGAMNLTLGPSKMSGEGLVYPFEGLGMRLEVLVALSADGRAWRVRVDIDRSQYTGNGADPLTAFQSAAELARSQVAVRTGLALDVEGIERQLSECEALTADPKIPLTASQRQALGIAADYPAEVDARAVEACLRAAQFVERTQGIRSPYWKVEAAVWKDVGRELLVCLHLGA